jgi:hypothetical protein
MADQAHATRRLARAIERLATIQAARLISIHGFDKVRKLIKLSDTELGPVINELLDRKDSKHGKRTGG